MSEIGKPVLNSEGDEICGHPCPDHNDPCSICPLPDDAVGLAEMFGSVSTPYETHDVHFCVIKVFDKYGRPQSHSWKGPVGPLLT